MGRKLTHREYIGIMFPFMLSTVTQPLLGAADLAVIGHLGKVDLIGGISVGTLIFNTIYWIFGFLRVSTTGMSAQLTEEKEEEKIKENFFRPLFIALGIGISLILLHPFILKGSLHFITHTMGMKEAIEEYYHILIWGAPLVLMNYVFLGWLMGQKDIKSSLTMQISGNILNIILDTIFVIKFGWGVQGVAYATLLSQLGSFGLGLYFLYPYGYFKSISLKSVFKKEEFLRMLGVNRNLMLRTICLLVHNNIFVVSGSSFGVTVLSANAVLFQIISVISYLLDGIANTSSIFAGRAYGSKDRKLMEETWRMNFLWGLIVASGLTGIFWVYKVHFIKVFTEIPEVVERAVEFSNWGVLYPLLAFGGLTFYGVFTGSSYTWPVFISTFGALIGFFMVWKASIPILGNHGTWLGLITFYFLRSVLLVPYLKNIVTDMEGKDGDDPGKFKMFSWRKN